MADGQTIIDTPDAMAHFRMCQVIASLSIAVRTGMTHSQGSLIKLAQKQYGCTKRTHILVLDEMKVKYKDKYGREYGTH